MRHRGLVHPGGNPQIIRRNDLQHGAARHDHIARVAITPNDQSVERTEQLRVRQSRLVIGQRLLHRHPLPLRLRDGGLAAFQIGFGHAQTLDGLVQLRFGGDVGLAQVESAPVVELRLLQHGLRPALVRADSLDRGDGGIETGFGHRDLFAPFRVVEFGQKLPSDHGIVLIHQHLGQSPLDLRTNRRFHPRL